jgi:hypothetical protein
MHGKRWWTFVFILGCLGSLLTLAGGGYQIVHASDGAGPNQIGMASGGGPIQSTFTIADEPLEEVTPAVAFNPDREEYLVVWSNDRAGCDDIQAQRVASSGNLVGGVFYVSEGCDDNRRNPAVAYNSAQGQYLVVWEVEDGMGFNGIHGRLVSGNGAVQGANDIEIRSTSSLATPAHPAVAYASTTDKFLVVWSETWHPSPLDKDIMGQVISNSGGLDGGNFTISDDTGTGEYRESPDVAYCRSRNEYLVAWRQRTGGGDYDIHARRVAGNGNVLGSAVSVSTLGHDEEDPAVAALPLTNNEGDYLVVWEIDTGGDRGVMARSVHVASDASFALGLYKIVANEAGDEINPDVAGTESGGQYLMVWNQTYEVDLGGGFGLVYQAIVGRNLASDSSLLGDDLTYIGGLNATHGVTSAGPRGDFLAAFDDVIGDSNIYARLWGNRIYLPLVVRNS